MTLIAPLRTAGGLSVGGFPTLVGTTFSNSATSNTASVSFHASAAAGDLGIVWVNVDDTPTSFASPSGWTLINSASGSHGRMWFKVLTAGDVSGTTDFLSSADENAWCTITYTGADFSGVTANDVNSLQETGSSSFAAETITSSGGAPPMIAVFGGGTKNDINTNPTGFSTHSYDALVFDSGKGSGEANGFLCSVAISSAANVITSGWTAGNTSNNSEVTAYLTL